MLALLRTLLRSHDSCIMFKLINISLNYFFRPLMISTQKVTSLAFSVHDGLYKEKKDLNPDQNRQAVRYANTTEPSSDCRT